MNSDLFMVQGSQQIRISSKDVEALQTLFKKHFMINDGLWIFGSRVDLSKRGGDIDLYIETHANTIEDAIKMRRDFSWDLEQAIGEQKVDIVLNILHDSESLPIYDIAKKEGVRLS